MGVLVNFSPEIRDWILHNLDRGCAGADLVESMISHNFEPAIARGLVDAFMRARREGAAPPQEAVMIEDVVAEYRYEASRLAPGTVIHTADREIAVFARLERPVIALLGGVMSDEECEQLIELARPRLQPSTVVEPLTGENRIATHRNSDGMFFRLEETPLIARLDRRISELMNCPLENGEGLQVLRYGPGAQNTPHFDFLISTNAANRESIARSGQRISSLVVYLNNVESGGETVFPEAGLAVAPHRGNAVYFEYSNSRQEVDHKSVHAGGPVHRGEKWAVTKWMRERRFISA